MNKLGTVVIGRCGAMIHEITHQVKYLLGYPSGKEADSSEKLAYIHTTAASNDANGREGGNSNLKASDSRRSCQQLRIEP
jgi:hypothetical protein